LTLPSINFVPEQRLNALLFTSDLDVLVAVLQLLLRPSQNYSAQPPVSHTLHISTARIQSLAKRWSGLSEHGIQLVDIVDQNKADLEIPAEATQVTYQFYRKESKDSAEKTEHKDEQATEDIISVSPVTPTKPSPSHAVAPFTPGAPAHPQAPGLVTLRFPSLGTTDKNVMDILADTLENNSLSEDDKFDLMCRIRIAKALGKGRDEDRQKLVTARLLAIAIYGMLAPLKS
jgi:E3 ubiquitin-protein ligase HUWE1